MQLRKLKDMLMKKNKDLRRKYEEKVNHNNLNFRNQISTYTPDLKLLSLREDCVFKAPLHDVKDSERVKKLNGVDKKSNDKTKICQ